MTISRLHEGKSPEGKIGEHWAKNGEKLPIVRPCGFDLTRSVRGDACSNFVLPGREESAGRANAKKDGTSVPEGIVEPAMISVSRSQSLCRSVTGMEAAACIPERRLCFTLWPRKTVNCKFANYLARFFARYLAYAAATIGSRNLVLIKCRSGHAES